MIVVDGVEMMDVHEAAVLAHRTPETIRRWVWSGRVRSVKQGNKHFVRRADIDRRVPEREAPALSLREWAARLPRAATPSSVSASTLVLEDRDERAGR